MRVVLWDINHIGLIESGKLKEGNVVEILNCSCRNGELHLSSFSDIKESNEMIENIKVDQSIAVGELKDVRPGQNMKVRAVIVQTFEPRFFDSKQEGSVGEKRALLNIVLDDGTGTIRAVLFGENIKKLGLTDEEIFSVDKFNEKKESLIGEEKLFSGNFRTNTYFNNTEMSIGDVEEINVEELVKELEAKSLN